MTADDLRKMRDAIHVCLMVREGEKLTEDVARERANNITAQLQFMVDDIVTAALKDAARGEVVAGTIGAQPSEPPVLGARRRELTEHCWWCRASVGAPCTTPDGTLIPGPTHLTTSPPPEPIGVVRAPRQNPGDGETADEHARRVIK